LIFNLFKRIYLYLLILTYNPTKNILFFLINSLIVLKKNIILEM